MDYGDDGIVATMISRIVLWFLSFIPQRVIYRDREKYLTRYYLLGGSRKMTHEAKHPWLPFNLFLHCFHISDVEPAHNHPWSWAKALILRGCYFETRVRRVNLYKGELYSAYYDVKTSRVYGPGMINRLEANTYHYVQLLTPTVWTLFFAWRNVQDWGFLSEDGYVASKDWIKR